MIRVVITILLSILLTLLIATCYTTPHTGEPCPACFGSGICNHCHGTGDIRGEGRCRTCGGRTKCIACGGTGVYRRIIVPWPVY